MTQIQEIVILGVISKSPKSGYQIKKVLDKIEACSSIAFSSLYYELKRLEKSGYISKKGKSKGSIYSLTAKGRAKLLYLVQKSLTSQLLEYDSYYPALAFASELGQSRLKQCLKKRLGGIRTQMAKITSIAKLCPANHKLIFKRALALTKAEISWIEMELAKNAALNVASDSKS